jgi:hypothetical protein
MSDNDNWIIIFVKILQYIFRSGHKTHQKKKRKDV